MLNLKTSINSNRSVQNNEKREEHEVLFFTEAINCMKQADKSTQRVDNSKNVDAKDLLLSYQNYDPFKSFTSSNK